MGGREAFGNEIDRLLGEALGDVAGVEIICAVEGRGGGALRAAAGVDGPVVDGIFEAGVGEQVGIRAGEGEIGDRIAGIDGGAGEALAGDEVEDAIVVQGAVEEARLGPIWIHNRFADGMKIKGGDVGLEIENIGEILGPVEDFSAAGDVQVVVIGEETGLRAGRLRGKKYEVHGQFKRGNHATSRLLPGFAVDFAAVFAGPQ